MPKSAVGDVASIYTRVPVTCSPTQDWTPCLSQMMIHELFPNPGLDCFQPFRPSTRDGVPQSF